MIPPIPWTANTSSESSISSFFLTSWIIGKQTSAPTMPITIAAPGETKPAAGVIVASPAIAPVAKPTLVGLPTLIRSISNQTSAAMLAPRWVLMIALAASSLAERAEPPLKPNQPIHNSAAPAMVSEGLCGSISWRGKPWRLPTSAAATSAETPAVVWTTIPPAKSSVPIAASQPLPQTQWATGT